MPSTIYILSLFDAACDHLSHPSLTLSDNPNVLILLFLPPLRPPAGLLANRWLLQEPLPGGAAAQGGECCSAGVQGDSSDCHPGAEESDDKAHIWWPLHLQSKCFITSTLSCLSAALQYLCRGASSREILLRDLFVFQSQQARLATLYLPLFGLLQENVNRLNVKEVTPFPINHSNHVREPPSGLFVDLQSIDKTKKTSKCSTTQLPDTYGYIHTLKSLLQFNTQEKRKIY